MRFPALSGDDVLARSAARWDFTKAFPTPAGDWLCCPICREAPPQPRFWRWHMRDGAATLPWRCDVSFKCVSCAFTWIHGVAVPRDYYEAHAYKPTRLIQWREVRKALEEG